MQLVDQFNAVEALFWLCLGLLIAFKGVSVKELSQKQRALLVVSLIAFGISDLFELQSGAWWRPWWLLLLKATCLMTFAGTGYCIWRNQKSNETKQESPHGPG